MKPFRFTADCVFEAATFDDAIDKLLEHLYTMSEGEDSGYQRLEHVGSIKLEPVDTSTMKVSKFAEFCAKLGKEEKIEGKEPPLLHGVQKE